MKRVTGMLILAAVLGMAGMAKAGVIEITEWMYKGGNGEFVEFTNVSGSPVDMSGWSYSDTDRQPGDVDLSAFGVIQPGKSVILTETAAGIFRTAWGLDSSVKIIGSNSNSNLGRSDEIHLYDDNGDEIDFLIFDDQSGKGPRTENKSCNIPVADYDETTALSGWALSSVGDEFGSWASSGGDKGTPGKAVVPEPATMTLLGLGATMIGMRRRSRSRRQ